VSVAALPRDFPPRNHSLRVFSRSCGRGWHLAAAGNHASSSPRAEQATRKPARRRDHRHPSVQGRQKVGAIEPVRAMTPGKKVKGKSDISWSTRCGLAIDVRGSSGRIPVSRTVSCASHSRAGACSLIERSSPDGAIRRSTAAACVPRSPGNWETFNARDHAGRVEFCPAWIVNACTCCLEVPIFDR